MATPELILDDSRGQVYRITEPIEGLARAGDHLIMRLGHQPVVQHTVSQDEATSILGDNAPTLPRDTGRWQGSPDKEKHAGWFLLKTGGMKACNEFEAKRRARERKRPRACKRCGKEFLPTKCYNDVRCQPCMEARRKLRAE